MDKMETDDNYLIEVLDSSEVTAEELSEFTETCPLKVVGILPSDSDSLHQPQQTIITAKHENEGVLIQKFVSGELDLPDLYTKLEPGEVDEIEDDHGMLSSPEPQREETSSNEISINKSTTQRASKAGPTGGLSGSFRKRSALSIALQGLMGEANLSFARGQVEIAEKICLEIIRQNPLASEPFFTLAEIYESRDCEKFLNFLTIAAHLDSYNRDLWIRIAELHIAKGNLNQARIYLSKAIKALPKDYDLRLRKAKVLEQMSEHNCAMLSYLRMIPNVPLERAELCLETAKKVASHFHAAKRYTLAMQAMEGAYGVCGHLFTPQDLNLYLELLILNKCYAKVVQCLREQSSLQIETEYGMENDLDGVIPFCIIPDSMIPDFRAKLCVSLIHLKAFHLIGYLIQNIHQLIPVIHERLDLYIDIAEALIHEKKYEETMQLLQPIVDGNMIDPPAFVWLRYAECLRAMSQTEKAIGSYYKVVELAPYCYDAKFTLSALLKQQGRHMEAIKALEQDVDGDVINPRLLYERCLMLKEIGDFEQYLEVGYVLLGRHSVKPRSRVEMIAAAAKGSLNNAEKKISELNSSTQDATVGHSSKTVQHNSDLTVQEEYRLFLDLLETAHERKNFSFSEKICVAMMTTKRFTSYQHDLERIMILACYFNGDSAMGFSHLREIIAKNISNNSTWMMLALMIQKGDQMRYHRFIRRVFNRIENPGILRLFIGHYHLYSSSYKYALNSYMQVLKEQQEPIAYLCVATVFCQMAFQKKVLYKRSAVTQAIAFAKKYSNLRMASCTEQEIFYNMGRLYHQTGMLHLALDCYERALKVHDQMIEDHEDILDLKHEIAYNIHLIYKNAGNLLMARKYLYKYCVI